MSSQGSKKSLEQTCRVCLLSDEPIIKIPCDCCSRRASGAHIDCFKYWVRHLKKFHTQRVRNYDQFDEVDCETCQDTIVFPKKTKIQCQKWSQIKNQKEIEFYDILPEISLIVILLIILGSLLYYLISSFVDDCDSECLSPKIMFSMFIVVIVLCMVWPIRNLIRLLMRQEIEKEAYKKTKTSERKKVRE